MKLGGEGRELENESGHRYPVKKGAGSFSMAKGYRKRKTL